MSRSALLSMDLQLNHIAHVPDGYLPAAVRALETARAAEIPVVHVAQRLRPGHVDVHPDNKIFGALPFHLFTADDPGTAIHPDAAPRGDEIVVHKNRVSAFADNDLRQILAAQGIDHLVLAGIATSGIVLSTALEAADLDYRVTVLSDACADRDPDLHTTLLAQVLDRRCEVMTTSAWADTLKTSA
ncbi:cysteine hydrolase family protein [Streptomyces sp. NPDC102279]|uniref:cysteine hydrolase family protein n=1 Tax=Streptomyces sp. NPDC102279 TaxID=3366153 RepID=UPI0037F9F558